MERKSNRKNKLRKIETKAVLIKRASSGQLDEYV